MNAWSYYDEWERLMTLSPETRDAVREGCKQSAAAVLPIVFDYLGTPECVLDVGAGEGHWTQAARNAGAQSATGLDVEAMHEWGIEVWDAEVVEPLPMQYHYLPSWTDGDRWPLTLCLEMAEHVSPAAGAHLVRELTRVSEAILWSAAIPGQGGDGHINEQWPRYWEDAFETGGFTLTDPFRDRLWQCADVEPWYRQNLLLAVPGDAARSERVRCLVDPVTWAHHRGVPAP